MSFLKDKPYWLKIGVVGFWVGALVPVFLLLGYVWAALGMMGFSWDAFGMIGLAIGLGSWGPWAGIVYTFCPTCSADTTGAIGLWLSPFTYFLYGAIIGFIIDKIKPRKQKIG